MRIPTKGGSTKGPAGRRGSSGRGAAPRNARTADTAPVSGPLRVVVGDRRVASLTEIVARLERSGHDVVARVGSIRAALEKTEYLKPNVLLVAPYLEDGLGVAAALACAKSHPGVAPIVLIAHPGASNPAARPDWGNVALAPMEASASELDTIVRAAVARARAAAAGATAGATAPGRGARAARS